MYLDVPTALPTAPSRGAAFSRAPSSAHQLPAILPLRTCHLCLRIFSHLSSTTASHTCYLSLPTTTCQTCHHKHTPAFAHTTPASPRVRTTTSARHISLAIAVGFWDAAHGTLFAFTSTLTHFEHTFAHTSSTHGPPLFHTHSTHHHTQRHLPGAWLDILSPWASHAADPGFCTLCISTRPLILLPPVYSSFIPALYITLLAPLVLPCCSTAHYLTQPSYFLSHLLSLPDTLRYPHDFHLTTTFYHPHAHAARHTHAARGLPRYPSPCPHFPPSTTCRTHLPTTHPTIHDLPLPLLPPTVLPAHVAGPFIHTQTRTCWTWTSYRPCRSCAGLQPLATRATSPAGTPACARMRSPSLMNSALPTRGAPSRVLFMRRLRLSNADSNLGTSAWACGRVTRCHACAACVCCISPLRRDSGRAPRAGRAATRERCRRWTATSHLCDDELSFCASG